MQLPRITIVTPSYNQAKYLPETIESVLGQDYPNLEYIIVDGGSTDGSVDIIRKYESHLAYWTSERDSGQSEAINKGFARSTGDFFNWINSDDVLFPGALHRIGEAGARDPDVDLIVGHNARTDADGRIIRMSVAPSMLAMSPKCLVLHMGQQSTFISSVTFRELGGVRQDLHCIMDAEFYSRVLAAGGRVARVRGLIGMIREHPEAKGVAKSEDWGPEKEAVFREHGISPFRVGVALAKVKLCRLLDGSYARSFLLLKQWQGRKPWSGKETGGASSSPMWT